MLHICYWTSVPLTLEIMHGAYSSSQFASLGQAGLSFTLRITEFTEATSSQRVIYICSQERKIYCSLSSQAWVQLGGLIYIRDIRILLKECFASQGWSAGQQYQHHVETGKNAGAQAPSDLLIQNFTKIPRWFPWTLEFKKYSSVYVILTSCHHCKQQDAL